MELLKPSPANQSPLTPLGFLERASLVYGDCTSVIYNDTTYTWSQTHRRCLQLASSLLSLGIKPGDVVSVVAPNTPAMYELHFGVPMSGAILNTINTRLDARTISIFLQHSEAKLVFVDYQYQALVLEAISLFEPESEAPIFILIADDEYPSSETIDSNQTYESLVEKGDPEFQWIRPASEWDPIVLNYTSGTTSSPKGVVHSHRGIFLITFESMIEWCSTKQPVYLWTLPMFHANGWSFTWGMAALGGTSICIRKFDASTIFSQIRKHSITHMCGAPVVLTMLANAPNAEKLPHTVQILTAGSPPPATVLFKTQSLGFVVTHGYGLTEVGGVVVSCAWKGEWNRLPATEQARLKSRQGVATVGMTELDVVDRDSGVSVERNGKTQGEIVLRCGTTMLGYLKDPVGTAACMKKNGWFYSGDVGVMHPDGYIEIKDRSKDVIISGGENLSSVEVESVLYSHPSVNEAAVVARPHEFWGESPCAFLSLKPNSDKPSEKDIVEFCRARMPHYTVPKTVIFMLELPKTSTGKIQKFILREMAKTLGAK